MFVLVGCGENVAGEAVRGGTNNAQSGQIQSKDYKGLETTLISIESRLSNLQISLNNIQDDINDINGQIDIGSPQFTSVNEIGDLNRILFEELQWHIQWEKAKK